MNHRLQEIDNLFQYLPEKDIPIAKDLLNRRKFVELKEIIDSDVIILHNKLSVLMDLEKLSAEEYTYIYNEQETKLSKLKELQMKVNIIAKDFMDSDADNDNDSNYYF